MDKKILILILILSALLRLYRLDELMIFIGDQGADYLISTDIITRHQFSLIPRQTSQSGVQNGIFFYYLQALALYIGNFNPVAPAIMTALFSVLSVFLMYKLGKLPAAILFAFSPLMVINSRIPIHVAVFPFFLLVYMLALKSKRIILCCLSFFILIQIHLSALLLIPITIIVTKNKKLLLFAVLIILTSPQLINLSFRKIISIITLKDLYITPLPYFLEIFQKLFSMETIILGMLFLPFFLIGLKKSKLILTWFFVALLGLIIKNSSAEHYFNLITPAFFLIIAAGLEKHKKIGGILLLIFSLSNLYYLPKRDFYMKTANNPTNFNYGVPLSQRLEIAKYIVNTSQNKPFNIKVIGDFDIYPSTGKNYEYLAFWLKGKPSEKQENLKYVIYEPKEFAKIYKEEGTRKEFENAIVEYRSN